MNHAEFLRLDASSALTPTELRASSPELFALLKQAEAARVKDAVVECFAEAPAELRRAVAEAQLASVDGGDVKDAVVAALRRRGLGEADLKQAADRLAGFTPIALLAEDVPLAANLALTGELAKARVHRLVAISTVPDEKAEAITARGVTETTIDDRMLEGLVDVGALTADEARELGATVGLYRMLDGDPALTEQVKAATFESVPGGRVSSAEQLVHLTSEEWLRVVTADGVESPGGLTPEQHAMVLAKRAALAYPTAAMLARIRPADARALAAAVRAAAPALDAGGALSGEADFSGQPEAVRQAVAEVRRAAFAYPGLGLVGVLEDAALDPPARVERVNERIGLLGRVAAANPETELLALDLSVGSDDLAMLSLGEIPAADRPYALGALKAQQRLLSIVRDPDDVGVVAAAGFDSATSIVAGGFDLFVGKTGLEPAVASDYFTQALSAISHTSSAVGSILDALGPFSLLKVGNVSSSIAQYFRRIDGWEDLFGSQDFCRCEHCSSILSPAAYFVDLLHFIELRLTDKVFTGPDADHPLALKVRRPDLWTLPLTCENTDTRIPLLTIVDEILENFIAKRDGFDGDLSDPDRSEIWRRVYGDRLAGAVDSFRQPFLLPLARLEAYLAHFDRTRAEIAATVGRDADAVAAAALGLSVRERDLITTPDDSEAFLLGVYGLTFGFVDGAAGALDAQELLGAIGVTRDELGDLLAGRFVQAGTSEPIQVLGERRDASSVQDDIERVHGLRRGSLDRLHRFTRLWRATGWTPRELDLTLAHLARARLAAGIDAGALRSIVRIRELARRFKLSVEETTVLYDVLPTTPVKAGRPALFWRLFNLDDFVKLDGTYPKDGVTFVHPALRTDPGARAPGHALQRLLAGLRVDADALLELIRGLAQPLGADPQASTEAARGFTLSVANLSLLYRHARLAQWLKLSIPDLFDLIAVAPGIAGSHVATLAELDALLEFADWLKTSRLKLDDLAYATGQPVPGVARPTPAAEVAQHVVDRVKADGPLTFAASIFTFVDDVTEAQSRAILAHNPDAVVAIGDGAYRLAHRFDPRAPLTIPAGITAPEPALRALLLARHATRLVPAYLAAELKVDVPKAQALIALSGADLLNEDLAKALGGRGPLGPLEDIAAVVLRLAILASGKAFDGATIDFVHAHAEMFGLTDVTAPTLDAARKLDVFRQLAAAGDDDRAVDLRAVFGAWHPADRFAHADRAALARVLGVEEAVTASLQAHLTLPGTAPEALMRLVRAAGLAAWLGVDGGTLADIADTAYDRLDAAANAVLAAFRAKYPDESKWTELIEPFEGRILGKRRDGLCDYLVHTVGGQFQTRADLYRYFLVDVEVDGCFTTSRIVAATGSLQLYVHRVLMDLEQDRGGNVHVQPSRVPPAEWDWRKHYRVWEANRKVFLWTENYLFPDLRDDKTPPFDALAAELLQKELDEQSVLDAYGKYLDSFREVAGLKIAGSYHDVDLTASRDVLHLFGVTPSDPPTYYYRRVENARFGEIYPDKGVVWGPWLPVDVKIPTRRVAPIVLNGRLHVFWIEIVSSPQNAVVGGNSSFVGYTHKLSLRYSVLRLDGRWTPPQKVSLYGPHPFLESDGTIDDPLADPDELPQLWELIQKLKAFGLFSDETLGKLFPNLITPRYDIVPHTKARDGYTLTGLQWQQVYPEPAATGVRITGAGYQLHAFLDLFSNTSRDAPLKVTVGRQVPVLGVKTGQWQGVNQVLSGQILWSGTARSTRWGDYAFAALVADAGRFERVLKDELKWSKKDRDALSIGIWTTPLAFVGAAEWMPLNHSLRAPVVPIAERHGADGILDVGGDVYLLQSSVRHGATWLLKRLGTTLAETVSRALFARGVDGLLDLETQLVLSEAPRTWPVAVNKIEDRIVTRGTDLNGPLRSYYWEIFFHIPFLIAQTLNAQGKYAEAQRWYQYIFNPTSTEVVADLPGLSEAEEAARRRDRNWRYLEFRKLGLPELRAILTDAKAIDAYTTDPFNPHAIARLRLSAYQKAIVMRYIDNLLDWADELFTQFQMETVNEAMMLYATAADILGDRPAGLGPCGEGPISPKTYETIKPFLGKGSEFLVELEHWTWIKCYYLAKRKSAGPTVDLAKVAGVTDMIFALPRVKVAGVLPGQAASAAVLRPEPFEDVADLHRVIGGRLSMTDGVTVGSISEPVTVLDSAAAAAPDGDRAAAVNGRELTAKAGLFSTELTSSVRWKELAVSGHESRYEPAAARRLRDVVTNVHGVHANFGWSLVKEVGAAFCVPPNKDLLEYWDRLEDRLFKLRNCMDITGRRRELSLFAPELDPMMLVHARAAGLSLDDVLDTIDGELPPYRFTYLLDKAKAFAATVQSFGSALLGALERKDAEELNELRVVHEQQLLALTTDVRQWEYDTAVRAVEALEKRRESIENRRAYYDGLVNAGLNAEEWTQQVARHTVNALHGTAATLGFLSAGLHLMGQFGSPFAMTYGGRETGWSSKNLARGMAALADVADAISASAALEAGFARREQGWQRDLEAADDDLAEIDKQIAGAVIRRDIAERAIKQHAKALEQTNEIYDMYRERFTNVGLYTWLSTETQRLYREAYNATYALARLAERAYRFERDDGQSLQPDPWDASKAGLRAGERLLIDLQRLEQRYLETNYRSLEIEQSFSLLQRDPAALVQLRQTGRCELSIPEIAFDLVYPGHYRRRIRAVRLTIPSITGPYASVSATLRLLESEVRRDPDAEPVPLPLPPTSAIATSTARNDGGVFELNFRDERYLPFEGAGAVSRWEIELPKSFRQFDYQTISDVILGISYTALENRDLRLKVQEGTAEVEGAILNVLANEPMGWLFSLRQDFPAVHSRLVHSAPRTAVTFTITDKHFPVFLSGRALSIASATLIVRTVGDAGVGALTIALDDSPITGFAAKATFGNLPVKDAGAALAAGILGEHTIAIDAAGDLAPDSLQPGHVSALDETKVADILLYVETTLT